MIIFNNKLRPVGEFKHVGDFIRSNINDIKSYPISKKLYQDGKYISSSFFIEDKEIIVSSIIVKDSDIKKPNNKNRFYTGFNFYTCQYGIEADLFLFVDVNGIGDVTDLMILSKIASTVIDVIEDFKDYYDINYIILNINEDLDPEEYILRCKLTHIYFYQIKYKMESNRVSAKYIIDDKIVSNFFFLY